ncbi:type VII secretion effector, SACOL2603 family [Pseudobutyrivibrio sp. OR37]|uniref:hypothetical protein n=1 Tax=Pseudobutyrivibrio sp. OR37 TaxID=1798186 RepID=UPI0008F152CC|nr:hypothetical protein [Pseudobutyrivibrio sp. OR37]SFI09870.1 type VII secretion effector, SACOL2603 family [Pseudobutyrivibrio sp. OR37]
MSEFCLDKEKFEELTTTYQNDSEQIKKIEYKLDEGEILLDSIDKYNQCLDEFKSAIDLFGTLMDQDINSMKTIKANWMNLDQKMAEITLKDLIFGKKG